uniref:BAG domain-containing protein n=1 Tax=Macrostomum lignano TaxID=282301 RepID=A0A1I8FGB4_9PLAT
MEAEASAGEIVKEEDNEKTEAEHEAEAEDDSATVAKEEADAARKALASQLESERAAFSRQAAELAASLASLAEEQRARRTAEARLAEAEASLSRLHGCIAGEQTSYTPQEKQEMTSDVRQLKSYFESLSGCVAAPRGSVGDRQQQPKAVRERARRLLEQRRSRLARS